MKTILISFIAFLFLSSQIFAQEHSGVDELVWYPTASQDGFPVKASISWKFNFFLGEPAQSATIKWQFIDKYVLIDGKKYTSTEIGNDFFQKPNISYSTKIYTTVRYFDKDNSVGFASVTEFSFYLRYGNGAIGFSDEDGSKPKNMIKNEWQSVNFEFKNIAFNLTEVKNAVKKYEKNNEYDKIIKEADNLFNSKQYEKAREKYTEASKLNYSEQYPKDKIKEIQKAQSEQNKEVRQGADNNTQSVNTSTESENEYYSSNQNNQYSDNSNNNQQAQNQQQTRDIINTISTVQNQTDRNIQSINQAAEGLTNIAFSVISAISEDRENERAREAELAWEREEEARRVREIEMAWNSMSKFENGFTGYFKKNLTDVIGKDCVYFYFGSIEKYKNDKSGSLKLSNVFPVYSYPDGSWPYIADVINKIKTKHGEVVIRGYFLTETNANNDKNNKISKARNSYFNSINPKAYYFTFNEKSITNNQNSDFWGNEKSDNSSTNANAQKDFWGNEESENSSNNTDAQKDFWGNEETTNESTNESTKAQTDFWGNDIEKKQVKKDSTKIKSDDDFWK